MSFFLGFLLSVIALFLIMLVLVQRGRGGGLAGALGGMGGSSAFGAKAGDVFTRITVVTAAIWILLCVASVKLLSEPDPTDLPTADLPTTVPPTGALSSPEQDEQTPETTPEAPAETTPEAPAETTPPPNDSND